MPDARHRRAASAVERWFRRHQRPLPWRAAYDPYHVWISEVMAQQTRLEVVVGYFERFIAHFPTVHELAAADDDAVTALWSGLGYYRRARMLRAAAIDIVATWGGAIPREVSQLLTLPGVGRYTAGAIASIAFGVRAPLVDGNVERVLARFEGRQSAWEDAGTLVAACRSPRELNQGLMELGAQVCKPHNPTCMGCPIRRDCIAFSTDRIHELPAPRKVKEQRSLRVSIYLIADRRGRILLRRENGPLMNALFHLPHGDASLLSAPRFLPRQGEHLGSFRHVITSRRVDFELFEAELPTQRTANGRGHQDVIRDRGHDYLWIKPEALATVPHPAYVAKALRMARNRPR